MTIFELPEDLLAQAALESEAAMGYQYVRVKITRFGTEDKGFLVAGTYFIPDESLMKAASGEDIQREHLVFIDTAEPELRTLAASGEATLLIFPELKAIFKTASASTTPPFQTKTRTGDVFVRVSPFRKDRRVQPDGSLLPGTYTTTGNDMKVVPSGLAAVGRYALPSRLPAIHEFTVTPPPGTDVAYGTVIPQFGMAGGGVEAYFPKGCPKGSVRYRAPLPMK